MKNYLFTGLLACLCLVLGCKLPGGEHHAKIGKGGRVYGGTFRLSETEYFQTLYPLAVTDAFSAHIVSQIYAGLVKLNPENLSVIPCIARKWEVDSTHTQYTFHLRKGVFFHDNPCFPQGKGREIKARDFKYTFELACTKSPDNNSFPSTFKDRLMGANKYYESSSAGKPSVELTGVTVIDNYTLLLSLEKPSATFLFALANPVLSVIPREGIEKYGNQNKVGAGPFIYAGEKKSPDMVLLKRNPNYWGADEFGNQLPYLDSVEFYFMGSNQKELAEFKKGRLDVVFHLPSESVKQVVAENIKAFRDTPVQFILERIPEMSTQYYEFITSAGVFKNKKVRQAFCYAIDRNKIVEEVLKGEGSSGLYGITPPLFSGYDNSQIRGYSYDPEKARKLLAEAGYPNGQKLPKITLELNSGGARNTSVALEVQKQLKENINVNIEFNIVGFPQKLEDAKYARADMFRSAWTADYPSPENFLWILYGKTVPSSISEPSFPNVSRYVNADFDKLYEKAEYAATEEETYKYLTEAEQIAMEDAPVMVLWYDENYRILQSRVQNFPLSPVRMYINLESVYFGQH